jgi:S1-C subfamily serine protease
VALGDERRLGLWILPLFLLTAAVSATLAGGLVVLYYSQQVSQLREETETARAQVEETAAGIQTTADEATGAIEDQVRRFREQLAQGLPVTSPNEIGVYAVSASHTNGAVRVGSTFVVFSDEQETFLVTTYGLVATDEGSAVGRVEVYIPGQTVAGRVHSFDRDLDLAIVVLSGGPLPVPEWRPPDEAVELGDAIYLAGIGGPDAPTVAEGRVAAASLDTIVPTFPVNSFTAGGPLLDVSARVVGIATLGYEPFGPSDGALRYAVPVRTLCRQLIRCTQSDTGAGALGDQGGFGAAPDPPATAPGTGAVEGQQPPAQEPPAQEAPAQQTPQPVPDPEEQAEPAQSPTPEATSPPPDS